MKAEAIKRIKRTIVSKQCPYYDCEDYTMAEYSYDDLSLIEKEFYEGRSN